MMADGVSLLSRARLLLWPLGADTLLRQNCIRKMEKDVALSTQKSLGLSRGSFQHFDASSDDSREADLDRTPKILILQGPVGPFFSELHRSMLSLGFSVDRVIFNSGDSLFARRDECIRFTGTTSEWETWLRFKIALDRPDAIILFGSNRPAHKVARQLAGYFGVEVLSLEEGYLRSGYISCEFGGNNEHSSLTKWRPALPKTHQQLDASTLSASQGSSLLTKGVWTAAYYLVRDFASTPSDACLFHRKRERVVPLSFSWGIHLFRRLAARITELPIRRALQRSPGYLLIPLQVASDSQLQAAARGWSTTRLIDASLMALRTNSHGQRVVFKLHPLERASAEIKRYIFRKAAEIGTDRHQISVIHSGRIGDLTKHSSGMVVINSTSAFSALHHDVPVLVLGDAIFRHDAIVTVGETEADILDFFKIRQSKPRDLIDEFLTEVKSQSLIPGDFYEARSRAVAIEWIIGKIQKCHSERLFKKEASE